MKRSNYSIVVPIENKMGLLIHSYTGAMDFIGQDLLTWFLSDQSTDQLSSQTINLLSERGHLWHNQSYSEKDFFKNISELFHKKSIINSVNSFWIIPTYRCNLRCYYCFQSHKIHAGEGIGKDVMSIPTIQALFTAFDELGGSGPRAAEGKGRYITLFGGEPLMEQTYESVNAIVQEAKAKQYRIGAITNGIDLHLFRELLGPDKIRWLQITLDGLGALNDKRRYSSEGNGFNKIVDNISLALDKGCQVSLRTNTDKTLVDKIKELENFAEEKGWNKHKGFSWYMTPVESHVNKSSNKLTVTNLDIIKKMQLESNNIIKAPFRSKFTKLLKALENDSISHHIETSACGAHTKMYYFDPQGLIYSCAEQVGKPEYAVGNFINEKIVLDKQKSAVWLSRHVGNMPVCSNCAYAFFCGGGCANAARLESGNFLGPRCYGIQESFQEVSLEYAKNKIKEGFLDNLALEGYEIKSINTIDSTPYGNVLAESAVEDTVLQN